MFCASNNVFYVQVRDEYRTDYDGGRGGYGKLMQQKVGGAVQDISVFRS